MTHFVFGDELKLQTTIKDDNNALVDPGTVTYKVTPRGGVETVYEYGTDSEVVRVSQGIYKLVITPATADAKYYWGQFSTNPNTATKGVLEVGKEYNE